MAWSPRGLPVDLDPGLPQLKPMDRTREQRQVAHCRTLRAGAASLHCVLLHQRVAGWKIFRSIYFLPTAISWVVLGLVAERFFAFQGTLNSIIHFFGFSHTNTNLLGYESTALTALGITFIFTMIGTNTMLFLTGLATLDPSLEEAARIDGAGRWRIFRSITLPHLARFIQLAFVMTVIALFSALFSLIFVMTGGGPDTPPPPWSSWSTRPVFSSQPLGPRPLRHHPLRHHRHGGHHPTATHRIERVTTLQTPPNETERVDTMTPPSPRRPKSDAGSSLASWSSSPS